MTLYLDTNLDNLDNAKNSIAAKDLQKGKATSMFYDEGLYFVSAGLNLHTLTIAVFVLLGNNGTAETRHGCL